MNAIVVHVLTVGKVGKTKTYLTLSHVACSVVVFAVSPFPQSWNVPCFYISELLFSVQLVYWVHLELICTSPPTSFFRLSWNLCILVQLALSWIVTEFTEKYFQNDTLENITHWRFSVMSNTQLIQTIALRHAIRSADKKGRPPANTFQRQKTYSNISYTYYIWLWYPCSSSRESGTKFHKNYL